MSPNFINYFYDEEKATMKSWAEWRTRFFSALTPWLVRFGVHPDAISYLGLSSLVGVVGLFLAHPFAACCLLGFYLICDGIDGAYARHLGRPTQAGAFTDVVTDQMGMVVLSLAMIHYHFVPPLLGTAYLSLYLLMISLAVIQNAMGIPLQPLFRSKYFLFIAYFIWGITGYNLVPPLMVLASVLMFITTIWSYLRLKQGIFNRFDRQTLEQLDQELAAKGQPVPVFPRIVTVLLPLTAVLIILLATEFPYLRALFESPARNCAWSDLGPTPGAAAGEVPQAITAFPQGFYFSSFSPADHRTRIYQLGPDTQTGSGSFLMPSETRRTQGLCFHDPYLYAVDLDSRQCYELDPPASISRGQAVVLRMFQTGIFGAEACAFVVVQGTEYLALSDYMHTRKTYFLDWNNAFTQGQTEDAIKGWYRNAGFSQGLAFDGSRLYEANSSLGPDLVFQLDPALAFQTRSLRAAKLTSWSSAGGNPAGLAFREGSFYTADLKNSHFYSLAANAACLAGTSSPPARADAP